jgi:hypothetical protein
MNKEIKKYSSYTRIRRGIVSEFCDFFERKISNLKKQEPKETKLVFLKKQKMLPTQRPCIQHQSKLYFKKLNLFF